MDTHPLASMYGNAPWVRHDENEGTWQCLAHPGVAPFGPGIIVEPWPAPYSTFTYANCCVECVVLFDEEIASRRDWWRRYFAC